MVSMVSLMLFLFRVAIHLRLRGFRFRLGGLSGTLPPFSEQKKCKFAPTHQVERRRPNLGGAISSPHPI